MAELHHECGIAAIYKYAPGEATRYLPEERGNAFSRLIPRILLDIQNRGQLAAGMTVLRPRQKRLLTTHKDVGPVSEVFRLNHPIPGETLLASLEGIAAIGHVRYATCGKDDPTYAQPFEREHIEKRKWFAFGYNGQLANYKQLRDEILSQDDFHLARETDTEIIMHMISQEISAQPEGCDMLAVMKRLAPRLDGAYNLVFLNAMGQMMVARDPLGFRPLVYADHQGVFAAASESVALSNLGFSKDHIHDVPPGCVVLVENGTVRVERFAETPRKAHCFFEWIYFANVASTMDERSVYLTRKRLGEELARQELVPLDEDSIVVPVPDTAKAAADAMAFKLGLPCLEGLIRNRYVGRTFIEGSNRGNKAQLKYTPLRHVLEGKRVFVVEDSIVRSTTLRVLVKQLYERGGAKEVHVRVACPPIIAPCYYGIDISSTSELFAPKFLNGEDLTPEFEQAMADDLKATTLRYLPVKTVAEAIGIDGDSLCQACIDTRYPTSHGDDLYQLDISSPSDTDAQGGRPLERLLAASVR